MTRSANEGHEVLACEPCSEDGRSGAGLADEVARAGSIVPSCASQSPGTTPIAGMCTSTSLPFGMIGESCCTTEVPTAGDGGTDCSS